MIEFHTNQKKEHIMNRLTSFLAVLGALFGVSSGSAQAQTVSSIGQYASLKGDSVLIRTDATMSYFVTCVNTPVNRACFVVSNGGTSKRFFTTQAPGSPYMFTVDSGYKVNDMQIFGTTCWFCGYKWIDTGQPIFIPGGGSTTLMLYRAFVGRFDITDVTGGSGSYIIIEIPQLRAIDKMTVQNNFIVALGRDSVDNKRLIELKETVDWLGSTYFYKIQKCSFAKEVMMDITKTNNRIVLLTRFNYPENYLFHKYYFALRYGSPTDFHGTNHFAYCYDTYASLIGYAAFKPNTSLHLSATNNGDGVTVSYILENDAISNPYLGKFLIYHIATEGAHSADYIYNNDSFTYSAILDSRFNYPLTTNAFMALLLRDESNNSILRFPLLNFPNGNHSEDVLYTTEPKIVSIAPYQLWNNRLDLAATGYFSNNSTKVADIREFDVLNPSGSWYSNNCFTINNGSLFKANLQYDFYIDTINQGLDIVCSIKKMGYAVSYTSASCYPTIQCNDGTNQ